MLMVSVTAIGFSGAVAQAKVVKKPVRRSAPAKPTAAQRAARAKLEAARAAEAAAAEKVAARKQAAAFPDDTSTQSGVRTQMRRIGAPTSSFCYAIEEGKIQGVNADKPVRVASVMKLMTTFWAVEALGPNYRYTTKIFVQPATGKMHIAGSRDPFFDRDRLYLLISDLNKLGIKSASQITADKSFRIDFDATEFQYNRTFAHTEAHSDASMADDNIKDKLMLGFNSDGWWNARKERVRTVRSRNPDTGMQQTLTFKTNSTDVVDSNPLAGQPGVVQFEIRSAPLKVYLKQMNILSINPVADELFHSMGGEPGFRKFLQDKYGMGDAAVDVHTGSGLPIHDPRNDTSITCGNVVRMIRRMDLDLEKNYKMDLADVMMVAGVDTTAGATFSEGSRSLIVKTGTLTAPGSVAKNLAGVQETSAGEVYFGIFMQDRAANSGNVRRVLSSMMSNFRAKRVERSGVGRFDSIDKEMMLKKVTPTPSASVSVTKG